MLVVQMVVVGRYSNTCKRHNTNNSVYSAYKVQWVPSQKNSGHCSYPSAGAWALAVMLSRTLTKSIQHTPSRTQDLRLEIHQLLNFNSNLSEAVPFNSCCKIFRTDLHFNQNGIPGLLLRKQEQETLTLPPKPLPHTFRHGEELLRHKHDCDYEARRLTTNLELR